MWEEGGKETDTVLKQWPNYTLSADLKYKIYNKSVNILRNSNFGREFRTKNQMYLDRLTLKRDALGFIETLENIYQSTRRAIPETLNFHQHCRENHRSRTGTIFEGIFNLQNSSRKNRSYTFLHLRHPSVSHKLRNSLFQPSKQLTLLHYIV